MNKKFSTLLTASLLVAGSFVGSAWADDIKSYTTGTAAVEVDSDARYVLVQNQGGTDYVYGMELQADGTYKPVVKQFNADIADKELKNFSWSISEKQNPFNKTQYSYSFKNAGGDLRVKKGATVAELAVETDPSVKEVYSEFGFSTFGQYDGQNASSLAIIEQIEGQFVYLAFNTAAGLAFNNSYSSYPITFYEIKDSEVSDDDLNALFNKKGFNFSVGNDVESNVFGGTSRVTAFEVTNTGGYEISDVNNNGKKLIIPEGIYFFTDRQMKPNYTPSTNPITVSDIDWLASTIIYVSPVNTVETTVDDRDEGQGFKLETAKVGDFIFQENNSSYKAGDLPIDNACFKVMYNNDGKYSVEVKNFYFKEKSSDDATALLTPKSPMALGVLQLDATKYLSTVKGDAKFAFEMSDASILDGKELLNTSKVAAVYNIQFVSGVTKDEKNLVGKYLTNGAGLAAFDWVAKGSDIANINHPSFQYTITNVARELGKKDDKDAKYVDVTFTNRETNQSFTVKLYPETAAGEDCYSFAFDNSAINVTPLYVKRNGYAVDDQNKVLFSENVIVKLLPATVDEYAGFYNVDNKSIRTIRYARDKYDTSNAWYTAVDNNSLQKDNEDYFVEEAFDAAQFQLIKADQKNVSTIARTFVYYNETTKDVDDVPNGDKLSAYTYTLRYVEDGTETDKYLSLSSGDLARNLVALSSATKFFIKENADGSVSLIAESDGFVANSKQVADHDKISKVAVEMDGDDYVKYLTTRKLYQSIYDDTELKTYLDAEIPAVSWAAEEGHVTLRNNTNLEGNYISMNAERDGILVSNDTEAFYLNVTDVNAVVPSFFISRGINGGNAESERMFMFNPTDSVKYPVNMDYDPIYQIGKEKTKAIFKAAKINKARNQMTISVKGENRVIANSANNDGVWAGLKRFKWQVVKPSVDSEEYIIRQAGELNGETTMYLASLNEKLYLTSEKDDAMRIEVTTTSAPTANESIEAESSVKVLGQNGSVVVLGAAGKNVTVVTVLGKRVASQVIASDNATIAAPAGVVFVTVDGETTKVVVK